MFLAIVSPTMEILLMVAVHNFFRFDIVDSAIYTVSYWLFFIFDLRLQFNFNIILFSLAVQLKAWYRKMRTIFLQTMKEIMGMTC